MEDKLKWKCSEKYGMSIMNLAGCWKTSGKPENIKKLLLAILEDAPELLTQDQIDELNKMFGEEK
jgi:hypothetical protein